MASSPAAQAYISGVIPFRKKKKKVIFLYLSTMKLSQAQWVWILMYRRACVHVSRESICIHSKHFGFYAEWAECTSIGKWCGQNIRGQDCKHTKGITENPSRVLSTILEPSQGCQKRNTISWIICSQMNRKQKTTQKYTRLIYLATYPHC